MKGDLNQADIFKHFRDKTTKSTVVDKKDLPKWVREATSGTQRERTTKNLDRALELGRVPGSSVVPGWKGKPAVIRARKNKRKGRK